MLLDKSRRPKFSNIETPKIPNNTTITPQMLLKRETIVVGKKEKSVLKCNIEYWLEQRKKHKAFDIIIDEAHTMFNARRSMSKVNEAMTDFLSLIRRMIGSNDSGSGDLILIT